MHRTEYLKALKLLFQGNPLENLQKKVFSSKEWIKAYDANDDLFHDMYDQRKRR